MVVRLKRRCRASTYLIFDLLVDNGHDVYAAKDGEVAIKILKEKRTPDLVITDFNMPNKNGMVVLSYCRTEIPDLPVILMTGIISEGLPDWKALGAVDSLQKPFKMEELLSLVKKHRRLKSV